MSDSEQVIQSVDEPAKSGLSGDVLASLDAIAGEEAQAFVEVQQDAEQAAQQEAAQQEQEAAAGWLQAVEAAKDLICAPFQEAEPVWTNTRMENLAGALARCDAVYGWGGIGGLFSNPLVGLAIASFPLAVGTAKAINKASPPKLPKVEPGAIVPDRMGAELAPAA